MTDQQQRSPADHVPALAGLLGGEHFPTGEKAVLKRMALEGPAPLAFHRLILQQVDEPWQGPAWQEDWRTLLCALALQRDGGFNPERPLGRALAQVGFSEARLERLLAARDRTLRALALRAARHLAAKAVSADWRNLADLLFTRDPEIRENLNRRLARDYYRAVAQTEKEN